MKKLYSLLMILAMVATFSACSKDDTPELPKQVASTAIKTQEMDAIKGSSSSSDIVFTRDDFNELNDFKKYVKSGKIQTTSIIDVSKIKDGAKFSNVKLTIKGSNPVQVLNLGEIDENTSYKGIDELNFLQKVIDEVAGKNSKSTLELSYKVEERGTASSEMKIKLDAIFKF